jgi:hypothetical protein
VQQPPPIIDSPARQLTKQSLNNSRQTVTRAFIAFLLNLALTLFLVEAGISLLDDALILGFGVSVLGFVRGLLFVLLLVTSILIYLLCGVTPMIPKRFIIPVVLFTPVAQMAAIPFLIYHFDRVQQMTLLLSVCQVLFGVSILFWVHGKFAFRWPVIRQEQLGRKAFTWLNLSGFVLANIFVLLPSVLFYLFFCASLAVDHFSGNFLALRSDGLAIRAKTYVRDDQKTVRLVPMMHIGEAAFYDQLSKSFTTNSVILLEGVTDKKNLIKRKLTYKRAARSLGLVEQQEDFEPQQGRLRHADVDVEQFSERTIAILNLVSLIHGEESKLEHLLKLIHECEDPLASEQLWDDLLTKRNANLLKQIEDELPVSDMIVVPWGAAHMRGIAGEIQKKGFRLADTREHQIVHFRSIREGLFHTKKERSPTSVGKTNWSEEIEPVTER